MQTYARQGGTSTILVHDDGLQSLNAEDREKRIAFYADHNIGWIARPQISIPETPSIVFQEGIYIKDAVCEGDEDSFEIALSGEQN